MKHLLCAIVGTLLLSGCGKVAAPVPPPVDPEAGKAIAQAECAGC
ncbi:MAG: amino acid ABC transporter substrate-binding protein, partial [Lysobacterales bacterium]